MYGVRSLTGGFSAHLADTARQWIGADIMIQMGQPPTEQELKRLIQLAPQSRWTIATESVTETVSEQSPDPVSVYLKAIDPAVYPFYGRLSLKSGEGASGKLDSSSTLVSEALLDALQVRVGDRIRINRVEFTISGVVVAEPGLLSVFSRTLPHLILSQEGLNRSRLLRFGGPAFYRVLLRTLSPSDSDDLALCRRLESEFPSAEVNHYTASVRPFAAALEWAIPVMNTLGLLCLAFGAFGIATAAYLHLLQRFETIAILKSLGATASQVLNIYLVQILFLVTAASALGIAGGSVVEWSGSALAVRYLGFGIQPDHRPSTIIESIVLGLLAACAAACFPLSKLRRIPAAVLLRRDTGERKELGQSLLFGSERRALLVGFALGTALVAALAGSWKVLYLVAGVVAALTAMYGLACAATAALFEAVQWARLSPPFVLRQAISSLYRYRRQSRMVAVALASSAALSVVAFLLQREVGAHVLDLIPEYGPNLLFVNVGDSQREQIERGLLDQSGLRAEWTPITWLKLLRVDGSALERLRAEHPGTWIQSTWLAACANSKPQAATIISGEWWARGSLVHAAALEEDVAKQMGVQVGSNLEFLEHGNPWQVRVAAITHLPPAERLWYGITLDCQGFPALDPVYYGGVYIHPSRLTQVRRALRSRFPGILMVETSDLSRWTQRISTEAAQAVTVSAIVVVIMALCLMLALMRTLHSFRVYELAVLRAIGARPRTLLTILGLEYLALGGLAGLAGIGFGIGGTTLVLGYVTGKIVWIFDAGAVVIVPIATALIAASVGLFETFSLLRPPPLEVLRRR